MKLCRDGSLHRLCAKVAAARLESPNAPSTRLLSRGEKGIFVVFHFLRSGSLDATRARAACLEATESLVVTGRRDALLHKRRTFDWPNRNRPSLLEGGRPPDTAHPAMVRVLQAAVGRHREAATTAPSHSSGAREPTGSRAIPLWRRRFARRLSRPRSIRPNLWRPLSPTRSS